MVHHKFIKEQVGFPIHTTQSLLNRSHNTVEPPRHKNLVLLVVSETYHIVAVFNARVFSDTHPYLVLIYYHQLTQSTRTVSRLQPVRAPNQLLPSLFKHTVRHIQSGINVVSHTKNITSKRERTGITITGRRWRGRWSSLLPTPLPTRHIKLS